MFTVSLLAILASIAFVVSASLLANERNAILNCHNAFRSALAKGTAQNRTGLMPAGRNLIQLQYDTNIENMAQAWANQCTMAHSSSSQRNGTGENLFMSSSSTITKTAALQQACQMWWAELQKFGIQSSLQLTTSEFNKGIGHWSQMAWATTSRVGCAVANCPNSTWKTYVVCNYNPAGNFLNQFIYQKGSACSGCAPGSSTGCNASSGLCIA